MKKIVVIAVLLLIGGGAGGYYFLRASAPSPPVAKPGAPDPVYLRMEPFVVPVMRNGVVDGFVRLEVTLEVPDYDVRREVDRHMPKLRNAMLADLHALVPLRRGDANRLTGSDVATIRTRLTRIIEAQVGPGLVQNVWLEEAHDIPPPGKRKS